MAKHHWDFLVLQLPAVNIDGTRKKPTLDVTAMSAARKKNILITAG